MLIKLIVLFSLVPFAELALLIKIGTVIGTLETLMLIIVTGMAGAMMVRSAGIQCLYRIQNSLRSGVMPTDDLLTGVLILVSGAFLITPGLITDTAGFLLLFPPLQAWVRLRLKNYLASKIRQGASSTHINISL